MHNSSLLAVSAAKVLPSYLLYRSKFFSLFPFMGKEEIKRKEGKS